LISTDVFAEKAVCSATGEGYEDVFSIDANKTHAEILWQYKSDQAGRKVNVLKHWYSGTPEGDGLGVSFIMVQLSDANGKLLPPSMMVID